MIRIRAASDEELDDLLALNRELLPESAPLPDTEWFGGWTWPDRELVAYAGLRLPPEWPGYAFLSRAGVSEHWRGAGLQKRLIRVRTARARRAGCHSAITYTSTDNAPSMCSLISCGFRPYEPELAYAGSGYVYWRKRLR